ncbi:hypothetical protein [Candidatus Harpocratesius sp.]
MQKKKKMMYLILLFFIISQIKFQNCSENPSSNLVFPVKATGDSSTIFHRYNSLQFSSSITTFEISDSYLFIATDNNQIRIFNTSDSLNPVEMSSINMNSSILALTLNENGNFLYISLENQGISVFNITDPINYEITNIITLNISFSHLIVSNNLLFAQFQKSIYYFDISNPFHVENIGKIYCDKFNSMQFSQPYLFLAEDTIGLRVVDFSNLQIPVNRSVLVDQINDLNSSSNYNEINGKDLAVDLENNIIYLAAENAGLLSIYLKNISHIEVINNLTDTIPMEHILLNDSLLFGGFNSAGLCLLQVPIYGYPNYVDVSEEQGNFNQMRLVKTTLFVVNQSYPVGQTDEMDQKPYISELIIYDCSEINAYLSGLDNSRINILWQIAALFVVFGVIGFIIAKIVSPKAK